MVTSDGIVPAAADGPKLPPPKTRVPQAARAVPRLALLVVPQIGSVEKNVFETEEYLAMTQEVPH